MKIIYCLMLFALLVSCSSATSGDAVQTAIVQTEMARPTKTFVFNPTAIPIPTEIPTPTTIPLKEINLSEIMFLPGDLPAGFEPSQIRSKGVGLGEWIGSGVINEFF
jgi:hypothetical protein